MTEPPSEPSGAVGRVDRVVRGVGRGLAGAVVAIWRFLTRWRTPLVLVPLLAGVAWVGNQGAQQLWADIPRTAPPPPDVICWNGQVRPSDQCGEPDGVRGLSWVFPSFRPYGGRCEELKRAPRETGRPIEWTCDIPFKKKRVTIAYSKRLSVDDGLRFIARVYDDVEPVRLARGDLIAYKDPYPRSDGTYQLTVAYTGHPFAVTVNAPGIPLRNAALEQLVQFRDAAEISWQPPSKRNQDPAPLAPGS